MATAIEHFSAITTATIKELQDTGVIQILNKEGNPMDLDSESGQLLISDLTTKIYEGLVKDTNTHLAGTFE
jgi:hypothetical protein